MQVFKNVEECINASRIGFAAFPLLHEIINEEDYSKWANKLSKMPDFERYIFHTQFNILNSSIMAGLGITHCLDDQITGHVNRLLSNIDLYLTSFGQLKADKSFLDKIKNLEKFNFLSTLSELSLAHVLWRSHYVLEFEHEFTLPATGKRKDVDLRVTDRHGNTFFIDVYMPNEPLDISGFFSPTEKNHHFQYKVRQKILDKFGNEEIEGLNGKIILAVNRVYFEMMQLESAIPFFNNDLLYKELIREMPPHVFGLILYEDDFGSENSFRFKSLLTRG